MEEDTIVKSVDEIIVEAKAAAQLRRASGLTPNGHPRNPPRPKPKPSPKYVYTMPMGLTDLASPKQRKFVKCQMETLGSLLESCGPYDIPKNHYIWTQRMYNILAHAQDLPKRDWLAQRDQEWPGWREHRGKEES